MGSLYSIETLKTVCDKFKLEKADIILLSTYFHEKYSSLGFIERPKYEKANIWPITKDKYGINALGFAGLTMEMRHALQITEDNYDVLFNSHVNNKTESSEKKNVLDFTEQEIELLTKIIDNQFPSRIVISASNIIKSREEIGGGLRNFLSREKMSSEWMKFCNDQNINIKEGWYQLLKKFQRINESNFDEFIKDGKTYVLLHKEKKESYIEESAKKINENFNQKHKEILDRIDVIENAFQNIGKLNIPSIDEFKSVIVKNEDLILSKSNEQQLYTFLKLNSFLIDFQNQIKNDIQSLPNTLKKADLISMLKNDDTRDPVLKSVESMIDANARLNGEKVLGFDAKFADLLNLAENAEEIIKAHILTLSYYHSMSVIMIVFFIENKKINYFDIYAAFEKMGVFDSTWQKNVLSKLNSIEIRLSNIESQLLDLNDNFKTLLKSSENIISELQKIDSSIRFNNLLSSIQTYQLYKMNKQ